MDIIYITAICVLSYFASENIKKDKAQDKIIQQHIDWDKMADEAAKATDSTLQHKINELQMRGE
jgi:hypothetical protein